MSPPATRAASTLACAPDATLVITSADAIRFVHVPEHQLALLGRLEVGQTVATAQWPAVFAEALVEPLAGVRRTKEPMSFDVVVDTRRGSHVHSVHLIPMGDDVVCTIRDDDAIVDQRMGGRDRELDRLAQSVDAYIWSAQVSADGEFGYRYYSPTVEEITGYPIEHFMSGPEGWLSTVHPEDRPKLEAAAAAAVTGSEERLAVEYRTIRPDGRTVWLRDHALIDRRPDGSRLLTGFVLDITAQRHLETEFLNAQRGETLGMLAGGIAHDFNNILTTILGGAEVVRRTFEGDERGREALAMIVGAAERATALCRQLLAYAGKGGLVVQPVCVSDLVAEMEPMLESLAQGARLEVRASADPTVVVADVTQLQQLVLNLLTNAADALDDDGTISVHVSQRWLDVSELPQVVLSEGATDGPYVQLEVKDDGAGMSAQTRERMFDPFFSTKPGGHGLGLSATLGIVKAHRGILQVDSAEGKGTMVRISLPRSNAEPHGEAPTRDEATSKPPPRATVLFVDDEEAIRRLATMALQQAGYEVVTAEDGRSGLAYLEARGDGVSAVVLDMTMPGMGGEEVLRHIRETRPALPVLLSSGHAPGSVADLIGETGPTHFLPKPYRTEALIEHLAELLSTRPAG